MADTIYVLESFYRAPRAEIAAAMWSLLAVESMTTLDPKMLLRAVEVYESRSRFPEAYLCGG